MLGRPTVVRVVAKVTKPKRGCSSQPFTPRIKVGKIKVIGPDPAEEPDPADESDSLDEPESGASPPCLAGAGSSIPQGGVIGSSP